MSMDAGPFLLQNLGTEGLMHACSLALQRSGITAKDIEDLRKKNIIHHYDIILIISDGGFHIFNATVRNPVIDSVRKCEPRKSSCDALVP